MERTKLEVDVSPSGFLPGMFVLAAHEDDAIRCFVQCYMLEPLGAVETTDHYNAIPQMQALMDRWVSCSKPFLTSLPDVHIFAM